MEKEFAHHYAVSRQILLEVTNVFEALFPNLFAYELWRQLLLCQKVRMNSDDEHLFIVTTIKNSNVTPIRQAFHAVPEIIMIEILARGRFERIPLTALRIYARHHVLDGAVLSSRVHRLK